MPEADIKMHIRCFCYLCFLAFPNILPLLPPVVSRATNITAAWVVDREFVYILAEGCGRVAEEG